MVMFTRVRTRARVGETTRRSTAFSGLANVRVSWDFPWHGASLVPVTTKVPEGGYAWLTRSGRTAVRRSLLPSPYSRRYEHLPVPSTRIVAAPAGPVGFDFTATPLRRADGGGCAAITSSRAVW